MRWEEALGCASRRYLEHVRVNKFKPREPITGRVRMRSAVQQTARFRGDAAAPPALPSFCLLSALDSYDHIGKLNAEVSDQVRFKGHDGRPYFFARKDH
ncbi:NADPH dehydrogenase [Pseudozyma hubeiensis SY62]|uniref:NADPH dehydrogenase n=1 Tax=Pseudozyma hubeiensis (strain SY62) TaxID=1305764 RepID=R9P0M5_PSEHS|nr:NADPH dehydrogenase [Pseudozyma hubeiensis SY62]GAC94607.1 NADPH dehydrogenase [Pseudozyma hubeiensis SY62]